MIEHPTSGIGTARALRGRHVLLALIGFFAVVFLANGVMIYQAVVTFGGVDNPDAYREGLAYNRRIAAAQAQAGRGWHDRLDYVPETARLRLSLTDRAGAGVSGLLIAAHLGRAATDRFDRDLNLEQTGPGVYEAEVTGLDAGWWTIDLKAREDDAKDALYESRRRLWIKP